MQRYAFYICVVLYCLGVVDVIHLFFVSVQYLCVGSVGPKGNGVSCIVYIDASSRKSLEFCHFIHPAVRRWRLGSSEWRQAKAGQIGRMNESQVGCSIWPIAGASRCPSACWEITMELSIFSISST